VAQRNAQAGFNNEHAEDNTFVNCIAGGRTPNYAYEGQTAAHMLPGYPATSAHPHGDAPLGNGDGFRASLSSSRVTFSNSHSIDNQFGLKVEGGSIDTAIDGGVFAGSYVGLSIEDGAVGTVVAAGTYVENQYGIMFDSPATSRASSVASNVTLARNGSDVFLKGGLLGIDSTNIKAPTVPAGNVTITNDYPWTVEVYIVGAATRVTVNSRNLGAQKFFRLSPGASLSIAYSKAPTWVWRRG